MHARTAISAATALTAVAALMATAGPAQSAHRPPPKGTRILLTFDHGESLKDGTRVRDDSRRHHPGRVDTSPNGTLRSVRGWFKRGVGFPHRGRGRAIIEVEDAAGLNPLRRPFAFGAAVRLGPKSATVRSNVVQKGYYNEAGGQFKLQLKVGGFPKCVVTGAKGRRIATAKATIADGKWHRLRCVRTPAAVRIFVDDKRVGRAAGATGRIANDRNIRIGGRKVVAPNKQYRGAMDSVFLRVYAPVR